MPFKSDEQRKAAFARMKGNRGGGPRPPKPPKPPGLGGNPPPHPGMLLVIEWMLQQGPPGWQPLPPGQGIPGWGGGSVTLTGGAIYDTPGSQWYISNQEDPPPYYGQLPSQGIPQYQQQFTQYWTPPESLLGQLVAIWSGLDPYNGQNAPMWAWDPGYIGVLEGIFSSNPGGTDFDIGVPTQPGAGGGGYWNPFN